MEKKKKIEVFGQTVVLRSRLQDDKRQDTKTDGPA